MLLYQPIKHFALTDKNFIGRVAFWFDKNTCRMANVVVLDTNAHIDYFVRTFGLDREKFVRIFVGADEKIFYPRHQKPNKKPVVFTYTMYQPLHGTEYIIRAAKELGDLAEFIIVGKGMEKKKIEAEVVSQNIKNIKLMDWTPLESLAELIAQADICLGGHFGNTEKARMVIAGKTFQFIAMTKPTIVTINPANQELFGSSQEPYFVKQADSNDLAEKIRELLNKPRRTQEIVKKQSEAYQNYAAFKSIKEDLNNIVKSLL
jgi:glycosyltransferase involved in cell wall biosynthesis